MSPRFANKIAIVTGAGNGIGIPLATRIAGEGASVVLADKDEGTVATPRIRKSHNEERREAWLQSIPLARYGEPHEIAAAALFLVSDDACNITGQTIAVDGGFSAAGLRVKNLGAKDGSY